MKKLLLFVLFLFVGTAYPLNKQFIIKSGKYYYGEGVSEDVREARDRALAQLTGQIAVHVAGSFERSLHETGDKLAEDVRSVLKTHSEATLRNVEQITDRLANGRMQVFCYMEKSKVAEIFRERKKLIAEICTKAAQLARESNYAYALKNYYFAAILLNSLPDQIVVYNDVNYTTEIPQKINDIIAKTTFSFESERALSEKEKEITLRVSNRNRPIGMLDFKFWDGSRQIEVQAKDGLATLRLVGASIKFSKLELDVKYSYYECRSEYKVVSDLWDLVQRPSFKAAKTVVLKKEAGPVKTNSEKVEPAGNLEIKNDISQKIIKEAKHFLQVLKDKNSEQASAAYQDDPFLANKISSYIKYNHPCPLDSALNGLFNKTRTGWEVRHIRVLNTYPSIDKQSTEYLTLDFSPQGKLMDVNVSVSDFLYQKFFKGSEYGNDWHNRQEIIKFLEKYRTAYLIRDINMVDKMFAEDALIIIGRRIEKKKLPQDMVRHQKFGRQPDYEYVRLKKQDYLQRQRRVFTSQQDIALDFSTFNIIKKNAVDSVYGVEMRQSYASTTYSDEGYLFLLIDFSEKDPLIYIRAWQPNEWNKDQLIRTANFKIHK